MQSALVALEESPAVFETTACDSCGGTSSASLYSFQVDDEQLRIVRCNDCGAVFLSPRPRKEEIGRFYPETYYSYGKPPSALPPIPSFKQRLRNRIARDLLGYTKLDRAECVSIPGRLIKPLGFRVSLPPFRAGGRLLDIGCGSGGRLLEFRRLGWNVSGLEISSQAAEAGRSLGLDIVVCDLAEAPWPDRSFDAITLYHVLEHVHQPSEYVEQIARLLKPGGVVLIAVPNFQSWERRLFGQRWTWLDVPIHLHHFEPARLRKLVESAGLTLRQSWCSSSGKSFEQSLRNAEEAPGHRFVKRAMQAKASTAAFKFVADRCGAGSGITLIAERL